MHLNSIKKRRADPPFFRGIVLMIMNIKYSFIPMLFFITIFVCLVVFAQQNDREAGIKAFNARDYSQAVQLLRKATKNVGSDAEAWYYLGAAYLGTDKNKEAIKALDKASSLNPTNDLYLSGLGYAYMRNFDGRAGEISDKALEINPKNPQAHYVIGVVAYRRASYSIAYERAKRAIDLKPDYAAAYLLKSESLVSSYSIQSGAVQRDPKSKYDLLTEATTDLEKYVSLIPDGKERQRQTEYLSSLRFFSEYYKRPENHKATSIDPVTPDPNETNVKIISKPKATYTDAARMNGVSGTIRLLIELASDGKVRNILVIKRLGSGLDEQALDAARDIKFTPATKNGVPISVVKTFEYSFMIY